ncbi:MAG: PLP-dependent aminotransferase family protein [Acutalibacteraceae bacterium]
MKKYLQLYHYYKDRIRSGQMRRGDRMPSIRKAAALFSVSTTTVENAYFSLQAEGYILPSPKRGFFVSYAPKNAAPAAVSHTAEAVPVRYDLKSGFADDASFDVRLWHRYMNSALRQEDRLCSYSEVQGEADLREAIADYIRDKRNVLASPDHIVVGAGIQSLFHILCSVLPETGTVSFPDRSFLQGIDAFCSHGFTIHVKDKDADVIYVSPSHMTRYGKVMPISRRLELVAHSEARSSLILEDDFDNDFLYASKPTPSLYALSSTDNIVYLSSFANVLTPGIHISFMVLTDPLLDRFREKRACFAQTASKTEQIALCGYLRDGHINTQIRKIRRAHAAKIRQLYGLLCEMVPEGRFRIGENGMQIRGQIPFHGSPDVFRRHGVLAEVISCAGGILDVLLNPSAVLAENIPSAAAAIVESLQDT